MWTRPARPSAMCRQHQDAECAPHSILKRNKRRTCLLRYRQCIESAHRRKCGRPILFEVRRTGGGAPRNSAEQRTHGAVDRVRAPAPQAPLRPASWAPLPELLHSTWHAGARRVTACAHALRPHSGTAAFRTVFLCFAAWLCSLPGGGHRGTAVPVRLTIPCAHTTPPHVPASAAGCYTDRSSPLRREYRHLTMATQAAGSMRSRLREFDRI